MEGNYIQDVRALAEAIVELEQQALSYRYSDRERERTVRDLQESLDADRMQLELRAGGQAVLWAPPSSVVRAEWRRVSPELIELFYDAELPPYLLRQAGARSVQLRVEYGALSCKLAGEVSLPVRFVPGEAGLRIRSRD